MSRVMWDPAPTLYDFIVLDLGLAVVHLKVHHMEYLLKAVLLTTIRMTFSTQDSHLSMRTPKNIFS